MHAARMRWRKAHMKRKPSRRTVDCNSYYSTGMLGQLHSRLLRRSHEAQGLVARSSWRLVSALPGSCEKGMPSCQGITKIPNLLKGFPRRQRRKPRRLSQEIGVFAVLGAAGYLVGGLGNRSETRPDCSRSAGAEERYSAEPVTAGRSTRHGSVVPQQVNPRSSKSASKGSKAHQPGDPGKPDRNVGLSPPWQRRGC